MKKIFKMGLAIMCVASLLAGCGTGSSNTKGEMVGSADVNTDAEEVIVSSRSTYVYSLDKIQKYSSVGDNTEEKE